jgi:hypothetical protein
MNQGLPARLSITLGLLFAFGCSSPKVDSGEVNGTDDALAFPWPENGKSDVFGRALIGVAVPYEADENIAATEDRLRSDMRYRRQTAWQIIRRVLEPVPLLGLAEKNAERAIEIEGGTPLVPRWQTWYGVDDFKRMFRRLYGELGADGRREGAPISDTDVDAAFEWNASAVDRSTRWPLERFFKHVDDLGNCPNDMTPAECARSIQSNFSGGAAGNAPLLTVRAP